MVSEQDDCPTTPEERRRAFGLYLRDDRSCPFRHREQFVA
jgi:hypothetical protein